MRFVRADSLRTFDMPTTAVVEAATVLREELRPPQYGTQFSEDASRTFYTKYLEYERRVERANLGDAVKYQLVSMSQLVENACAEDVGRAVFRPRFNNTAAVGNCD